MNDIIPRPMYLEHVVSLLNRGMMLFLVGQRRVGKSYILKQLDRWLHENRPQANVLYINKESKAFRHIVDSDSFYDYVADILPKNAENYLLVDEVQDIDEFQDALRSFYAEDLCQVVATGSNAYIFSGELATRLSGRYIEIPVYSLSYPEFLIFNNLEDSNESLMTYLRVGGLPGLRHFDLNNENQVTDYLQGVYNTVIMQDVITRERIRNPRFIESLSVFLADNVGKLVSPGTIAGTMISQGEKISNPVVSSYLEYLCNALIVNEATRYDIHGKRILMQQAKYYFADHGIRNMLADFNVLGSIERILENVVYNHLRAKGFSVRVGVLPESEVDFVATRGAEKLYIQVTYIMEREETRKREIGNLLSIKDNYPKYVVSMDPIGGVVDGVKVIPLREFLTMDL